MKNILLKYIFVLIIITSCQVRADMLNPCSYLNVSNDRGNQLDVGNDPNFERIKQQNNRQIVIACQQLQIKQLEQRRNDWNRDNY